ncbi:hypothetical protein AWR26_03565 [Kosakonia oryzae]|uniref:Uncharacterized protein n=2 Tax=Kosakonia oryzae TaxID=497725 RepID=A0AA94H5I8_9ENTR|nr:hypothetical protein AWR26_03565 [Kosakonia oryzae]UDJ85000.1 hypothetical protein I5186_03620 [Kosakonia oryzae]SFC88451.1 hypothetical protein SAMN05216286_3600 [Kosakonia oryzae]
MQEIQAIQATTHLANATQENTATKADLHTTTENGAGNKSHQDESTKVTLSSRAESHKEAKGIKAEQQLAEKKEIENHQIDYSLAMTGIPQFGGRLVTVVKYPDGSTEMIDAFSGKKVTQEELDLARAAKENSEHVQRKQEAKKAALEVQALTPGESQPTDLE